MTINDCTYVLVHHGPLRVLSPNQTSGPYVLRVGSVPVGVFGFDRDTLPLENVQTPGHYQQKSALSMAYRAFEMAKAQCEATDDERKIRHAARLAYRTVKQEVCIKLLRDIGALGV